MKRKFQLLLILFAMMALSVNVSAADTNEGLKYDLVGAGVGAQGTYLCKVSVYSKK